MDGFPVDVGDVDLYDDIGGSRADQLGGEEDDHHSGKDPEQHTGSGSASARLAVAQLQSE